MRRVLRHLFTLVVGLSAACLSPSRTVQVAAQSGSVDVVFPSGYSVSRHEAQIRLSAAFDDSATESVQVKPGMFSGFQESVYLRSSRLDNLPKDPISIGISGGPDMRGLGTTLLYLGTSSVPLDPGSFQIEVRVDLFETDVAPTHASLPWSRKFSVLSSRNYVVGVPQDDGK